MLAQEFAGGRGQLDRAGRRDVVGGDLVAEHREDAGIDHVDDRIRLLLHAFEVRRVLHIGRRHVPAISLTVDRLDLAPVGVALEYVGVALLEDRRRDELPHVGVDLLRGRPDILEVHRLAVLALADRLDREILGHGARQRIGDDQRRRGQIVGLHVRTDAAFEVAVTRQHGGGDDAVVVDRLRDIFRQRAGIADAGGAAEADQVEADLVEIESAVRSWKDTPRPPGCPAPARSSPRALPSTPWRRRCAPAGPRRSARSDLTCWCRT